MSTTRRRPGWRLVVLTVVTSVVASGSIVAGLRVAQHELSSYVQVAVHVDLPHLSSPAKALLFGLHESSVTGSDGSVSAHTNAAGVISAVGAAGNVVGQSVVSQDPLLKPSTSTVSYLSTAEALTLQTPALATSSPLLSALITATAAQSPYVAALAGVLRTEAAANPAYLAQPGRTILEALSAAQIDVSARLSADFPTMDNKTKASEAPPVVNGSRDMELMASIGTGNQSFPRTMTTSVPGDEIVLPDTSGNSACSSHSVQDALCLQQTFPLSLANPELSATNWTAGWQFLYESRQLATGSRLSLPVAILPPITNAPPTISGLAQTAVSTGINYLATEETCQALQPRLTGSCTQPSFVDQVGSRLLSQLTLSATSDAVYLPLTAALDNTPLSTIGMGKLPTTGLTTNEEVAWGASVVMSAFTEFALPTLQLLLDSAGDSGDDAAEEPGDEPSQQDEGETGPDDTVSDTPDSTDDEITKLNNEADETEQLATNKADAATTAESDAAAARDTADAAQSQAEAARKTADDYKTKHLDPANAAKEHAKSAYHDHPTPEGLAALRSASGRAGGFQAHYNELNREANAAESDASSSAAAADQAETMAQTARREADDAAEHSESLREEAEQTAAKQREAEQAAQNKEGGSGAATSQSLIAQILRQVFILAIEHPEALAQGYDAITSGNAKTAIQDLQPVLDELEESSSDLIDLFAGDVTHLAEGALISVAIYSIPIVGEFAFAFDFASNAFGLAQDIDNLVETARLPDRHDFPPIDDNYPHGTKEGDLATVFVGAGTLNNLANTVLGRPNGLFVARTTPVCTDTILEPDAAVSGRTIGILNVSNVADLHFAGGIGGISGRTTVGSLDQTIPFAVIHSSTPLGAGGASFGSPPNVGDQVKVVAEGSGTSGSGYHTFFARVTNVISPSNPLAFVMSPTDDTVLSAPVQYVGGFVYATTGPNAGQLIGLAEVEHSGEVVALTGGGVNDIVAGDAQCNDG